MGAYQAMYMMDKGVLPKADKPQMRATYIAGLFRAMRFGDTEAHGRGAAMQYRYIRDKGGIVWDAKAERFRIDPGQARRGDRRADRRDRPAAGRRQLCRGQGVLRQMGQDGRRGQGGDREDGPHPGRHLAALSGQGLRPSGGDGQADRHPGADARASNRCRACRGGARRYA